MGQSEYWMHASNICYVPLTPYDRKFSQATETMHTIDFADQPDFSRTKALVQLDTPVADAMRNFPLTAERALCAVHFCGRISSEMNYINVETIVLRRGYMRASLAEFVGMEEALKRDLLQRQIAAAPIQANSGTRPLLHIIRELRNFELHLHSSPLTDQIREVIWAGPSSTGTGMPFEYQGWIIDDLTERQFRQLRNAKHYRDDDIRQLIAWFNVAQREWGIHDLLLRAIETFCSDIISNYASYLPGESTDV